MPRAAPASASSEESIGGDAASEGAPIAILNRNKPAAYLVPAKAWEEIMDRLEDAELAEIVRARAGQKRIRVKLEDL